MNEFMGIDADMSWTMVLVFVVMFAAVIIAAALDLPVTVEVN